MERSDFKKKQQTWWMPPKKAKGEKCRSVWLRWMCAGSPTWRRSSVAWQPPLGSSAGPLRVPGVTGLYVTFAHSASEKGLELVIGERWARLRRLVSIRAATAGTLSHSDTDSGSPVTLCNGPKWFKCSGFNHPTGFAGLIVSALM